MKLVLKELRDSTGFLVSQLARLMEKEFEECLCETGISRTMWTILASIALDRKERPSEIAENIGLDRAIVARMLGDASEAGLCKTLSDPDDGRSKRIQLTPKGRRVFEKAKACSEATNAEFLSRIDAPERRLLSDLITKMLCKEASLMTF